MKYISILFVSFFVLSSCGQETSENEIDNVLIDSDVSVIVSNESEEVKKQVMIDDYNIVDVTGGEEVRGIATLDTRWHGKAAFANGMYSLAVVFENLPEPQNWDFYEWWIVQKEPFQFISTGKIEKKAWMQVDIFTSDIDYRSYDFYVLTLEPDDGDPAPADHILEWTLEF